MTETHETKTEIRIVHTRAQAMVAHIRGETICALHDYLISVRAAEWLMKDLNSDPHKLDHIGNEVGHIYDKAVQFLDLLDFSQPPKENAYALARDAVLAGNMHRSI